MRVKRLYRVTAVWPGTTTRRDYQTKAAAEHHAEVLRRDAVLRPWPVTIPVAQCDHADLECPPGTCDWSGRDGRDG